MSMSNRVEEAAGVIPDVYYDLIARVIPGIMFYICLDYACSGTLNYDKTKTLLDAVIGVVAFYVLGFVLDVFGDMVVEKILGPHNAIKRVIKKFPEITKSQDRSLFVKLCAEMVLLRSLMLTSLIFLGFSVSTHIFKTLPQYLSDTTLLIISLLASVLLILLFGHFNKCTVTRLNNHVQYYVLVVSSADHTPQSP